MNEKEALTLLTELGYEDVEKALEDGLISFFEYVRIQLYVKRLQWGCFDKYQTA